MLRGKETNCRLARDFWKSESPGGTGEDQAQDEPGGYLLVAAELVDRAERISLTWPLGSEPGLEREAVSWRKKQQSCDRFRFLQTSVVMLRLVCKGNEGPPVKVLEVRG